MMSGERRSASSGLWALWVGVLGLWLGGCVQEYTPARGQGEACEASAQCASGLICQARVCVEAPALAGAGPVGGEDLGVAPPLRDVNEPDFPDPDLPPPPPEDLPPGPDLPPDPDMGPDPDLPPDPDMGMLCVPGERDCFDNSTIRVCQQDGAGFRQVPCQDGQFCQDGGCARRLECIDVDGDGFPAGPDCGPNQALDCNDDNPEVSPRGQEACDGLDNNCDGVVDEDLSRGCATACGRGREVCRGGLWSQCTARQPQPEACGNDVDDDCDGRVDEDCGCCTPDQCDPGEVCLECACVEAPVDRCVAQNQPCDPNQTPFLGDYACIDFSNQGREGSCLGVCDLNAPRPDATCPAEGTICAFELDGQGQGLCVGGCDPLTQTGCYEGQGCVPIGGQGACLPAGELPLGAPCQPDIPVGECGAGLVCIDLGDGGGTCEQLCTPLAAQRNAPDLCRDGLACFPFDVDTGVCADALGLEPGARCGRFQVGQLCATDTICAPAGQDGTMCQQLCRREEGSGDCPRGQQCRRTNLFDNPDLGLCR